MNVPSIPFVNAFALFATFILSFFLVPPLARGEEVVITAVGDIMLSGSGRGTYRREGYVYPFAATSGILRSGDVAIGNLETPLSTGGTEFRGKRYRFRTAPEAAVALKQAGFAVVTLANNHILDYGAAGLSDTIRHLDREGILHCGAGDDLLAARREAVAIIKGKRLIFLSYSLVLPKEFFAGKNRAGTAPGYPSYVVRDIGEARQKADYVIVSFHWGKEMASTPSPIQIETAHRAIDAGADLVIGHHPHVLQGAERYKNGVILYSLGNFAFGSLSAGSSRSAIARVTLDGGVREVELIPLNVLNREVRFQPKRLAGKEGEKVVERFSRISEGFGTKVVTVAGRYLLDFGRLPDHGAPR